MSGSVAIVGMACRFPGASTPEQYWQMLRDGVEPITRFTNDALIAAGVPRQVCEDPAYVPAAATLSHIDQFDAAFFGFSPREARLLDPQQRLFLECAWEALERGACPPDDARRRTAVFSGVGFNRYVFAALRRRELLSPSAALQVMLANDSGFLATRVSHVCDLRGPSISLQTACSTSLVAAHLACQSLLQYECDAAIAGGATIRLPHVAGYQYEEGGIGSPDGHCRAFDARAAGTVFGSGAGAVVLRRLEDALADGDPILAVIRGTAVNNDGADKMSYAAPSVTGQARVVAEAQEIAGAEPDTIQYIEAHGTGTQLGDPIEVEALTCVFRRTTSRVGFCALGSVKTNFGHLDTAAGIAGLVKVVLMLQHRMLPPTLHFTTPNPQIDLAASPFFVNTSLRPWPESATPRRAGVSSFGIGGTNAHAVLEEAPARVDTSSGRPSELLVLSAKSPSALGSVSAALAQHLVAHPDGAFADVAWTLQHGRRVFPYRRTVVAADAHEAMARLTSEVDPKGTGVVREERTDRAVVFMFPGQGTQHVRMAAGLYSDEPIFRAHVDECAVLLRPHFARDIRELLYPPEALVESSAPQMETTAIAQPALFVVEYALAQLWRKWGVTPRAVIGHSLGEIVAACVAGIFSLPDALALVAARGRLMQAQPAGAMTAVLQPEPTVRAHLTPELTIAAINSERTCVVSGPSDSVTAFESRLHPADTRRLRTSRAFHSVMMDPIVPALRAHAAQVPRHPARIPLASTVTGQWLTDDEAVSPEYWGRQLREPVRFADALRAVLMQEPDSVLLEVGVGHTLADLARQHPACTPACDVVASLGSSAAQGSDSRRMLQALGRLWMGGAAVDWSGVHSGERRLGVALPTYPFERQPYWIDDPVPAVTAAAVPSSVTPAGPNAADSPVEIMLQQIDVLNNQLDVLRELRG